MVVRIHIKEHTWTTIAVAPAVPDLIAFLTMVYSLVDISLLLYIPDHFIYSKMSSNNLRSKTEVSVDQQLEKMLNMAAG